MQMRIENVVSRADRKCQKADEIKFHRNRKEKKKIRGDFGDCDSLSSFKYFQRMTHERENQINFQRFPRDETPFFGQFSGGHSYCN